jgi:hypothetical protein
VVVKKHSAFYLCGEILTSLIQILTPQTLRAALALPAHVR